MKPRLLLAFLAAFILFLAAYLFSRPAGGPKRPTSAAVTKAEAPSEPAPRRSLIPPSAPGPTAPQDPEGGSPRPSGEVPPSGFDYAASAVNGLSTRALSADEQQSLQIPEKLKGVIITEVDPRSGAAGAALLPGDVIVRADFKWIDDETNTLEKLVGDRSFTALTVYRNGVAFDVVLHKPYDPTQTSSRTAP